MSSASEANALDVLVSPAVQQVLDAMQAAEINPEDALEISLVLLNFLQEYHVENLEELLADERPDPISIAVWAADSARLKTARQLLGEVLGEDEDEDDDDDIEDVDIEDDDIEDDDIEDDDIEDDDIEDEEIDDGADVNDSALG
jgi:phosphopantothenoylcysteine synthetase/decarboxylase